MKCAFYGNFEYNEDGRVIPLDLPAMTGIPVNREVPDWLAEQFLRQLEDFGNVLGEKDANDIYNQRSSLRSEQKEDRTGFRAG